MRKMDFVLAISVLILILFVSGSTRANTVTGCLILFDQCSTSAKLSPADKACLDKGLYMPRAGLGAAETAYNLSKNPANKSTLQQKVNSFTNGDLGNASTQCKITNAALSACGTQFSTCVTY